VTGLKSLWIIAAATLLLGCLSGPPAVKQPESEQPESQKGTTEGRQEQAAVVGERELALRLNEYLENGLEKIDQGVISEGISQLVTVLAEAEAAGSASGDIRAIVGTAETELTKIAAALEMEAGTEWVDANKNQISGSSIDVGGEQSLNPSVIVTYNYGSGKALVTGAPIYFEFLQGSGVLTNFVATNDYGQANCSIARLGDPNRETIVRASLEYRVKGYSYPFEGITKDFVYVPPSRNATILAMEKAGEKIQDDPIILDSVYNRLKDMDFDFSQYNGVLLGDEFMKVFGGDPAAIRKLGLEKEVSYLVMVLNDGYYVNQIELGGKKYNIFKSETTATTRIIRVSDGKIMYSGTVQAVGGQGGTEGKAILDGFRKAAAAMAEKLDAEYPEIDRVLSGH
jgi:hypothetical protein